ncbi:serine hydrolase [Cryptosporangium phraense]|uniref:Serine hydrolase n=1 Tax=Cryptosporangium phraense TaxID=2593070 RepID=A0A545AFZ3_9ACTN|nr:serine hydrolase [Cryptosporangium phraense]TQS40264.1 serine hydrolase [Cryptosporangium phraense]
MRRTTVVAALLVGAVLFGSVVTGCQDDAGARPGSRPAVASAPVVPDGSVGPSGPAVPETTGPAQDSERSAWLGRRLRRIVDAQRFDDVVNAKTGAPPPAVPNVDAAVIELDDAGRPVAAANTLLSQDYPHGVAVPVSQNWSAPGVDWTHWSNDVWAAHGRTDPLIPARASKPLEFMAPYPASVFKLMVAFGIGRLADRGGVRFDETYDYRPRKATCPGGRQPGTHEVSWWLDAMLTYSDNGATCALLMLLHERGGVTPTNAELRDLGLTTLQIRGTDGADGGGWSFEGLTMTALDTARLLLLFTDAPGILWRTPTGEPVTTRTLSRSSRHTIRGRLAEQGLNQALSTANWCGQSYPAPGIPQRVPSRWIDTSTGIVSVAGRVWSGDVRGCAGDAQVEFDHKTGLVESAGADAGIVTALPGRRPRHYVVAVFSNLGCRYADHVGAHGGVCRYTEKLATLGAAIDRLMIEARSR